MFRLSISFTHVKVCPTLNIVCVAFYFHSFTGKIYQFIAWYWPFNTNNQHTFKQNEFNAIFAFFCLPHEKKIFHFAFGWSTSSQTREKKRIKIVVTQKKTWQRLFLDMIKEIKRNKCFLMTNITRKMKFKNETTIHWLVVEISRARARNTFQMNMPFIFWFYRREVRFIRISSRIFAISKQIFAAILILWAAYDSENAKNAQAENFSGWQLNCHHVIQLIPQVYRNIYLNANELHVIHRPNQIVESFKQFKSDSKTNLFIKSYLDFSSENLFSLIIHGWRTIDIDIVNESFIAPVKWIIVFIIIYF